MKATELARKCENVKIKYNTIYMWGCFGQPVTDAIIEAKAKQYPTYYTASRKAELKKLVGKNYFGFDCVNLIKGILWGWKGTKATNGGAVYLSNGVKDVNADSFFNACKEQSSDFSNIQIGEAVWMRGHIGIYIGDGLVVECTPNWKDGVQITACLNIGARNGYNGREWRSHGKIPYVEYESDYPKWVWFEKEKNWWFYNSSKSGDYVKAKPYTWQSVFHNGKKYFVRADGSLVRNVTIDDNGEVHEK